MAGLGATFATLWWLRAPPPEAMQVIGPEAAYILCERVAQEKTRPGRDPWREHLPTLGGADPKQGSVPRALLTNNMLPSSLLELGLEPGSIACAAWLAPTPEELARTQERDLELHAAVQALESAAVGDCGCALARQAGVASWTPACGKRATPAECGSKSEGLDEILSAHGAMTEALAASPLPRTHWRVAGEIGKTGRLLALHADIADFLKVSGLGYTPDGRRPEATKDPLVNALLEVDGVQLVHRGGGGRGITVVRELGRLLVLDHFEHMLTGPRWASHHAELDKGAAEVDALVAGLALPTESSGPHPSNPMQAFDYEMMMRLDELLVSVTVPNARPYDAQSEHYEMAPPVFARLRFESLTGGRLVMFGLFTEAGLAFSSLGDGGTLAERAAPMQGHARPYKFVAGRNAPPFVLRGTPLQEGWFDGTRRFGALVGAVVGANPSASEGSYSAFKLQLPVGPLPGKLASLPGLAKIRGQISELGYTLSGKLQGGVMRLELSPPPAE